MKESVEIMNELYKFDGKRKIQKYIKYKFKTKDTSYLINSQKEKDYEYYICDWCGDEIKILSKKHEMTGGTVILPHTLTKKGEKKLVLCNKCLRPVLKSFEEEMEQAK